ncbi:MAG TPA: hypothetical protein VJ736_00455 [Actinomycetota bacterium]|jgi:hypothetical protein|nr:hypothetical protein [Actinomycetota bacterium]
MAAKTTSTNKKKTTAKQTSAPRNASSGKFSAEERAAMKEYAQELKAQKNKEDGKKMLQAAIAKMKEPDRTMAKRVDALIMAAAPDLAQRTWYGMPAYARGDKVVCFFQDAQKFKARYATFGFSDEASLDKGGMWPTSFALMELTPAEEKKITELVKKAVK